MKILQGELAVGAKKAEDDRISNMKDQAFSLSLQFPGARLNQPSGNAKSILRPRIGWLLLKADINSASARYRCFHFARTLSDRFESAYFTSIRDLRAEIKTLDAIIVVKRLDRAVIDIAALAQDCGKPVFVDLCDDLLHPLYPNREEPGQALIALRSLAPVLAGIVVPSAEMAERVASYLCSSTTPACPCHVIPDVAETSEVFAATKLFIKGRLPHGMETAATQSVIDAPNRGEGELLKRIVWFGNYGAAHSNFGLFSLRKHLRSLRDYHKDTPLELVVISNSRPVFDALIYGCGFPTRYVPWSGAAVYSELHRADAALLTTGTDDFCTVKSSNRVVQALACGVPVIAEKSTALVEFEGAVLSGNMRNCLDICLQPENAKKRAATLAEARRILDRYTPEALARSWAALLSWAIGKSLTQAPKMQRSGAILVAAPGDMTHEVLAAVKLLNSTPGFDYQLLVSTKLLEEEPGFFRVLHTSRNLPRFYSDDLRGIESAIKQSSYVFFGSRESICGTMLTSLADEVGVTAAEFSEVPGLDLVEMMPESRSLHLSPRTSPGANPQHTNQDGSVDWAFVIHNDAQGWILDAICNEIGSRQSAAWKVVGHKSPPPPAKNLFFSHFSLLERFDAVYPETLDASQVFVWYTHPREETPETVVRSLELFTRTTRVIFTCESNRTLWVSRGLPIERTAVVLGGADPMLFQGHARGGGCVGLSSSFYERKNPDLLLEMIKALPHRNFTLLGRNWNRYARFEEMLDLPNFTYLNAPYRDYPRIYATFDVFLSISMLEGGPIPLVEAMMCNAVPVSSNTGFAPDLIRHGENGFLFDVHADAAEVCELIEKAYKLTTDVRATVLPYSWDNFSAQVVELAR